VKNRVLVRVRGDGQAFALQKKEAFRAAGLHMEPILTVPTKSGPGFAIAQAVRATWLRVDAADTANPWDAAHAVARQTGGVAFGADGSSEVEFVEPDIVQPWLPPLPPGIDDDVMAGAGGIVCKFADQDAKGGKGIGPGLAWNQDSAFSEFIAAKGHFGGALQSKLSRVVVAHLDTGYDPSHITLPLNLDRNRQRNFVDKDFPKDATDRVPPGRSLTSNRGHGTATLALLAGGKPVGMPDWAGFTDFIGGAPFVTVIPIRIADWVVRFSVSTMVQGIDYARQCGAHVLSMSMGGVTSAALVDAVNVAYDSGLMMVAAAGNNYPATPSSIVFPARYRRVLAACGVMADGRAYAGLSDGEMDGNFGPRTKMETALGAYTPNVPWAVMDCQNIVGMDGAGTSSATPQIAAAAALWLAQNFDEVMAYPEPWMRGEAVRQALFASAAKSTAKMGMAETFEKIGMGVLKANAALGIKPALATELSRLPEAREGWGWLEALFGGGVSIAPGAKGREDMLKLELTQIAQRCRLVDEVIKDNDAPSAQISKAEQNRYLEAALELGNPSKLLKSVLTKMLRRSELPVSVTAESAATAESAPAIPRKTKQLPSPNRRLRIYALDPSIGKSVESVVVNETVLSLPWEDLGRGPVGEYLEVIDVDHASNRVYDPVDLNTPKLLAQDGWPPSEGNPEFHQQMVYAVAMKTIRHFEEALGRKALWAPRRVDPIEKESTVSPSIRDNPDVTKEPESEDNRLKRDGPKYLEVPRLRIYPHALRAENAYYSPSKVALLFGYFRASTRPGDATSHGSMVFSCLSSDIIAHETTHALLDGLHRRFQEISNPDVPAFHEAFADIVALFQHFTIPELVRFQIAQSRGKLDVAKLLGSLAKQFGEGTQRGGPLRDYLGEEIKGLSYATTREVHARGSILTSAVFQAFLKIVDRRTADLVRIATSGTGILPAGMLHPDLVNRLADETMKAAKHVLHMCIRALDYCPAVDLTFGEYLRAIITADIDLVPNDDYNYRVAFIEAFRERDLIPRDVRTVSEETLAWGTLDNPSPKWLEDLLKQVDLGWGRDLKRSIVFDLNEDNRWKVWRHLKKKVFTVEPHLHREFGLIEGVPRYDSRDGTIIKNVGPGETTFEVVSVRPARRIGPSGSFHTEVIVTIQQRQRMPLLAPENPEQEVRNDTMKPGCPWFWFRGGTTLILGVRDGVPIVRYNIIKRSDSKNRLARQRLTAAGGMFSPLRSLYFNQRSGDQVGKGLGEPFAIMHADYGEHRHG
jgi:hypothetical protein